MAKLVFYDKDINKNNLELHTFAVSGGISPFIVPMYVTPMLQFRPTKLAFGTGENPPELPYYDFYGRQYHKSEYVTTMFVQTMFSLTRYRQDGQWGQVFPNASEGYAFYDESDMKELELMLDTNLYIHKAVHTSTHKIWYGTDASKHSLFDTYFKEPTREELLDGLDITPEDGLIEGFVPTEIDMVENPKYVISKPFLTNQLIGQPRQHFRSLYLPGGIRMLYSADSKNIEGIHLQHTMDYREYKDGEQYLDGYAPVFLKPFYIIYMSQDDSIDTFQTDTDGNKWGSKVGIATNFIVTKIMFGATLWEGENT